MESVGLGYWIWRMREGENTDNSQEFGLSSYVGCVLFTDMENVGGKVGLLSKDNEFSLMFP